MISAQEITRFRTEYCLAPEATQVQLVGDFTRWTENPINMEKDLAGIWQATVTLGQGRHSYRVIADGQWCDDPECALRESNPYGSEIAVCQVA